METKVYNSPDSLTLSFVGDIFPSNMYYTSGIGLGKRICEEKSLIVDSLRETVSHFKADFNFGNLEVPLISDKSVVENSCFVGWSQFAHDLHAIGFNCVSIANNHILEYGKDGFESTIESLHKAGLEVIGFVDSGKPKIVKLEWGKIKIGLAGFNNIHDIHNPGLYCEMKPTIIKNTIQRLKSEGIDLVIISLHWGDEYVQIPSRQQTELAHELIDCGANIIIGHHPHVVQVVEEYKNGVVFYSLGNFLFDFLFSETVMIGMAAKVTINKNGSITYTTFEVQINDQGIVKVNPSNDLYRSLQHFNDKRNDLLRRSSVKYDRYYLKLAKYKQLFARIKMKIYLLKLLFTPSISKSVTSNIYKLLTKKLKG